MAEIRHDFRHIRHARKILCEIATYETCLDCKSLPFVERRFQARLGSRFRIAHAANASPSSLTLATLVMVDL